MRRLGVLGALLGGLLVYGAAVGGATAWAHHLDASLCCCTTPTGGICCARIGICGPMVPGCQCSADCRPFPAPFFAP